MVFALERITSLLREKNTSEKNDPPLAGWLQNDLLNLIPIILEQTKGECRVRRIILHGSHHRGNARPDSDVDVAVLVDSNPHWNNHMDGYDCFPTESDIEAEKRRKALKQRLIGQVSEPKRFSIGFYTSRDLEEAVIITRNSPKGNFGRNVFNGRSLYCDSEVGWWHNGSGLKLSLKIK